MSRPYVKIEDDLSDAKETRLAFASATAQIFQMPLAKRAYLESFERMLAQQLQKMEQMDRGEVIDQAYFEGWFQGGYQMLVALTNRMVEFEYIEVQRRSKI